LKHPRGVVPTARANELAEPISRILAQARNVIGSAAPFDPASSTRRFSIGAPDGLSAVVLPPLLAAMRQRAPSIDISIRNLQRATWEQTLTELDNRSVDVGVLPLTAVPPRFVARTLFEEDFVVAMRGDHPLAGRMTLKRYCEAQHVLVSPVGDPHGHIDVLLERKGLSRRVALAVPNFMLALAALADTHLLAALPRRFVAMHGPRFRVTSTDLPVPYPRDRIRAIAPKVAMMDTGLAWLFDVLVACFGDPAIKGKGSRPNG
jgi:DNA-binding transcriptional LysR family regulator